MINEIDYDNVGASDSAEFIELFNAGAGAQSLVGWSVVLVNGANSLVYQTVTLDPVGSLGPGEYLLIGPPSVTGLPSVPAAAKKLAFGITIDVIQNGPADGLVLLDSTGAVVDSLSYEGATMWNKTAPDAGVIAVPVQEGAASTGTLADSNTNTGSLCRIPNGSDSNVNATDFKFCATLTPGAVNQ